MLDSATFSGFCRRVPMPWAIDANIGGHGLKYLVAIVLQAAIFAILHPYDILAVIAVFCIGFFYGLLTWYGQGLESSSAMHAVNNMFAFLAMGLGLQQAAAPGDTSAVVINLVLLIIPIIIVLALDKKFNWFSSEN